MLTHVCALSSLSAFYQPTKEIVAPAHLPCLIPLPKRCCSLERWLEEAHWLFIPLSLAQGTTGCIAKGTGVSLHDPSLVLPEPASSAPDTATAKQAANTEVNVEQRETPVLKSHTTTLRTPNTPGNLSKY